jgi:hypothetical protein
VLLAAPAQQVELLLAVLAVQQLMVLPLVLVLVLVW